MKGETNGSGRRILFLTTADCDYLSDAVFHGLRTLFGGRVVDHPKVDRMYATTPKAAIGALRGHGFTLYGLLDDPPVDRPRELTAAAIREYDLVVVGNIRRQYELYASIHESLDRTNAVLLDGADPCSPYKYSGIFWRQPSLWRLPPTKGIPYFKRELTPRTLRYRSYFAIPTRLASRLLPFAPWKKTAFAIPAQKIASTLPQKHKVMASHIVDPEIAACFDGGRTGYVFDSEDAYYADLRSARFAVTTKRFGWECLRHYEIAAAACVPCFRDLQRKPETCAPHGLDHGNCIAYTSRADLLEQIDALDEAGYRALQEGALRWVRSNTTVIRAIEILCLSGHADWLSGRGTVQAE